MNRSTSSTLACLQVHYRAYNIDIQSNRLLSALLRLGYGVKEIHTHGVEGTTLLVLNLKSDLRFFEKLTRLIQHFGIGSVNSIDAGVNENMRTYSKEERGARIVITKWGDQVLRECGLLQRDEVHILDKDIGLRLAYFICSAAGEIQQHDVPPAFCSHVFASDERTLTVSATTSLKSPCGIYLLKLYQALVEFVAAYDNQEPFEVGVRRVTSPLREEVVRRLQQEAFWRDDTL